MAKTVRILAAIVGALGLGALIYKGYKKNLGDDLESDLQEKEDLQQNLGLSPEVAEEIVRDGGKEELGYTQLLLRIMHSGNSMVEDSIIDPDEGLVAKNVIHVRPDKDSNLVKVIFQIPKLGKGAPGLGAYKDGIIGFTQKWESDQGGRILGIHLNGYLMLSVKGEDESDVKKTVKLPNSVYKNFKAKEKDSRRDGLIPFYLDSVNNNKIDETSLQEVDLMLSDKGIQNPDIAGIYLGWEVVISATATKCEDLAAFLKKAVQEINIFRGGNEDTVPVTYEHILFYAPEENGCDVIYGYDEQGIGEFRVLA